MKMPPPREIPKELVSAYTMNGQIELKYIYVDNASDNGQKMYEDKFNLKIFNEFREKVANRKPGYYNVTDSWLYQMLDKYPVKDKSVCVVGAMHPWYEAVATEFGAKTITVIEYNDIKPYNDIKYIKPSEIGDSKFDMCISISSFEHDGLGRYGDPLKPDGDIEAMALAKTYIKKDGIMFLGVPFGYEECIYFNAHRVYKLGGLRMNRFLEGWEIIDSLGTDSPLIAGNVHPVLVLRNK